MSFGAKSPESAQARAGAGGPGQAHSPWHSPVPYLFGGLAAMLGLIAFALLILACSYWKLSGYLEGDGEGERDIEAGQAKNDETQKSASPQPYQEKFLVIMAGQENPTFLATPANSSRTSSFGGSTTNTCTCTCDDSDKSVEMAETVVKQGSGGSDQVQRGNGEAQDTSTHPNH
ncbi:protein GLUTAMINE DUMPER 3 [Senna tora]|uniref:Protein GLUTAMINE DUMPER 3 n=1 Tax=Senna tora TaxID=362788 RepID=A0A834X3V3_9FABA|nr:protein GLUTAMINE DUMPER 3 [Senna tora]